MSSSFTQSQTLFIHPPAVLLSSSLSCFPQVTCPAQGINALLSVCLCSTLCVFPLTPPSSYTLSLSSLLWTSSCFLPLLSEVMRHTDSRFIEIHERSRPLSLLSHNVSFAFSFKTTYVATCGPAFFLFVCGNWSCHSLSFLGLLLCMFGLHHTGTSMTSFACSGVFSQQEA